MKIKITLFLLVFFSNSCFSYTLFETEFNEINFNSDNIKKEKEKKINELKLNDFKKIIKNVLTKENYKRIEKNFNETFINNFIKSINIDQEKIINNNYFANVRINFDKNKIINYFRINGIGYVDFIPEKMFLIIYEKNNIGNNFLSKNNSYYNYLYNNFYSFFLVPKLDINDRFIINENDIENRDISKINILLKKYSSDESIIIFTNNTKNNYYYEIYYYTDNKFHLIKEMKFSNLNYKIFFNNIYPDIINYWKIHNTIDNKIQSTLNCDIKFFKINELKEIKKNILDISQIDKILLKKISHKKNNYDLIFFGNKKYLINNLKYFNLLVKLEDTECNISLK